jgi:hypothetical protein
LAGIVKSHKEDQEIQGKNLDTLNNDLNQIKSENDQNANQLSSKLEQNQIIQQDNNQNIRYLESKFNHENSIARSKIDHHNAITAKILANTIQNQQN